MYRDVPNQTIDPTHTCYLKFQMLFWIQTFLLDLIWVLSEIRILDLNTANYREVWIWMRSSPSLFQYKLSLCFKMYFLYFLFVEFFVFFQSIIFIRDRNSRGQEVSAYIDYAHRLKVDEFEIYFNGKKKLFPRRTDLSFYNWDRNVSTSNASPNYQVIAENACGLLFKNKCDRKIVNVDPKAYPGDSTTRTPIETDLYLQVVIYDHILRRKT
uniref:Cilia- and flagella-associated protein 299 n=1 Tax=Gopherus evgoodei TaxID=1825980 RepID=A0A8C4XY10_9SAUR